jgi:hypothetical protein
VIKVRVSREKVDTILESGEPLTINMAGKEVAL